MLAFYVSLLRINLIRIKLKYKSGLDRYMQFYVYKSTKVQEIYVVYCR